MSSTSKKGGRKPLPERQRRLYKLEVPMNEEEFSRAQRLSAKHRESMAQVTRAALLKMERDGGRFPE